MVRLERYDKFTSLRDKSFVEVLLANNHELDVNSIEK